MTRTVARALAGSMGLVLLFLGVGCASPGTNLCNSRAGPSGLWTRIVRYWKWSRRETIWVRGRPWNII